jgi:hypothetical protein
LNKKNVVERLERAELLGLILSIQFWGDLGMPVFGGMAMVEES